MEDQDIVEPFQLTPLAFAAGSSFFVNCIIIFIVFRQKTPSSKM
ncbi:hypothetical protein bthur0007_22600 [Bacillus thuringiensis serovar monterrey BGSC 4AJ1]|nr:hypothetical protein bthur0007_22600 [Bacillus thuringiensis serovar monterrey BGSC 4AJ1]